ncbi:MAG: NAD(P)/FAD-dependent oxidoreductase [Acidimicrobiales bacterium]
MGANDYDAIVIGGGHNGLVSAAYLAKAGKRTVVLERRSVVGGAAVTEQPFGPDYKVTMLSYVVSLLAPTLQRDLDLARHGYRVYPQHGYFVPYVDGRSLQLPSDPARRRAEISKFSSRDADAMERFDEWLHGLADVLGPLLSSVPPSIGSLRPRDLLAQGRLAWKLKGLGTRGVADVTRLFSMSVADLLDDFFESPQMLGVMSVSGVIGTWAGPRSPGTAFVMAHHKIGDVGDGQLGSWGFPEGGMGGLTQAMASAARSLGAEIRTDASVAKVIVDKGRVAGVALTTGEELRAPTIVTTVHPKIVFLQLLDCADLPSDFVDDIERWNTRSGTVKVNFAVDRLPEFTSKPGFDPEVHGGTIVLARSLDEVETAFQDAVKGRGAERPFADICIPSVFDPTLAPPGHQIVSMFTQWVPAEWADKPMHAELEAYADRLVAAVEEVAPGFTNSILHRKVVGPYEMEHEYGLIGGNIFHGELSPNQLFHMRPAAGYADFTTPIAGLYQAGSATHGGGGVTGIPAMNAVKRIAHDEKHARWHRVARRA